MNKLVGILILGAAVSGAACKKKEAPAQAAPSGAVTEPAAPAAPQAVPLDPNNIVSIAKGSKDHTTLVAALVAADYVTAVSNPGPLTVFAPTDAAFAKLPKGTVEGLVQPDKKADLQNILKYHVVPAVYEATALKDGQVLGMANGGHATVHIVDGKVMINDATIVASVRASNGVVHVIDGVLMPQP